MKYMLDFLERIFDGFGKIPVAGNRYLIRVWLSVFIFLNVVMFIPALLLTWNVGGGIEHAVFYNCMTSLIVSLFWIAMLLIEKRKNGKQDNP